MIPPNLWPSIRAEARLELARRSLWDFCRLMAPDFYTDDKAYLRDLCDRLTAFRDGPSDMLIVNLPPRHGKSRTAELYTMWALGRDPSVQVITAAYNEELSGASAKAVRNAIMEVKADPDRIVYSDVFPSVRVRQGDGSMKLWALDGAGHHSYLATSPGGTVTGFGASLLIIDDLVKNAAEALSERRLDQLWRFYTDTLLSRREAGLKTLIIMTRWAERDLAGRAIRHYARIGRPPEVVAYPALKADGSMLCPSILDRDAFDVISRTQDRGIVAANYQQEPIDIRGRLYGAFKTYSAPGSYMLIRSYTDTADEGSDYLCSITFGETAAGAVHILDVVYTQDPMEITEGMVAEHQMREYGGMGVSYALVESNNGGRGFARAVSAIIRERGGSVPVMWFRQTASKKARILTHAPWIMERVHMPAGWEDMWPEFWHHLVTFTRDGAPEHDDAEDALTGVAEMCAGRAAPAPRRATVSLGARRQTL